jgi:hypothetical protein
MPQNKILTAGLLIQFLFASVLFAGESVSSSLPPGGDAASSGEVPLGDNAPFHPFWNGEISAAYFAEDGGQKGSLFFLTGWDRLTPQGGFFEAKVFGGTQQIEKIQTASGGIEMGGGVGLGDLTPSLLVNLEHGGSDYNAIRVLIGFDKKLSSVLQLNLFLTGEVTSHQGPLGPYVGLPAGSSAEVDNLNAWGGGSLKWTLLSPLDLTLTFKTESDETVKIQDPAHVSFNEVDTTESMDTLALQAGLALDPHWRLSAEGQGGLEASPAGTFYSKRLAQTITQSTSQNVTFAGFSLGLDYHF